MAHFLDDVEWKPTGMTGDGSALPYATHKGVIVIDGKRLKVYQLNTGQRIIDADDFEKFFGNVAEEEC